jgi:hypothetical protein
MLSLHLLRVIRPLLLCLVAAAWSAFSTHAEAPPSWRSAAASAGLSDAEIGILAQQQMVITTTEVEQIFMAYHPVDEPVLITSDTVISAFNGVLQESMRVLEMRQRIELKKVLAMLQQRIGGRHELLSKAYTPSALVPVGIRRAQLILATAQVLLGDAASVPASLRAEAQRTADELTKGAGIVFPEWLGKSSAEFMGMDAHRFKPVSFYADDEALSRYFRAVTMLQSAALFINDDTSLIAASVLGDALAPYGYKHSDPQSMRDFFSVYEEFFGPANALSILDAERWSRVNHAPEFADQARPISVDDLRKSALQQAQATGTARTNDLLASKLGALTIRVWPSAEFADNRYLHDTEPRHGAALASLPIGMEIAAALGSRCAADEVAKALGTAQQKSLAQGASQAGFAAPPEPDGPIIEGSDPFTKPASPQAKPQPPAPPPDVWNWQYSATNYQRYMSCLSGLLDAQEPDAPPVFGSKAWQTKSCQTVMAGWANMRHAMALQARFEASSGGIPPEAPGYVEPDPEFFGKMATMAERWHRGFQERHAFEVDDAVVIDSLRSDLASAGKLHGTAFCGWYQVPNSPPAIARAIEAYYRLQSAPWPEKLQPPEFPHREFTRLEILEGENRADLQNSHATPAIAAETKAKIAALLTKYEANHIAWLKAASAWLESKAMGEGLGSDWQAQYIKPLNKLESRWHKFISLSQRLESMAHRQLRGLPLSAKDHDFILSYGYHIAQLMGYECAMARDDAPLCAVVLHDPKVGLYTHAGLARPRLFYMLYPAKTGPVLVRGAVNCYVEREASTPLTDTEWKSAEDKQPSLPGAWLRSITPGTAAKREEAPVLNDEPPVTGSGSKSDH